MSKAIAVSFAPLLTASVLTGCDTTEGAGQDVERGGEGAQDATD